MLTTLTFLATWIVIGIATFLLTIGLSFLLTHGRIERWDEMIRKERNSRH